MRISDWSSDVCSSDLGSLVLVPSAPGIGSNKHDLQDFAGDRSRHALERSGRTQDARDTFAFLLLSPDEVPDAGHDHLAPIDILDKLVLPVPVRTTLAVSKFSELDRPKHSENIRVGQEW